MTEILLTATLRLNSINQSIWHKLYSLCMYYLSIQHLTKESFTCPNYFLQNKKISLYLTVLQQYINSGKKWYETRYKLPSKQYRKTIDPDQDPHCFPYNI